MPIHLNFVISSTKPKELAHFYAFASEGEALEGIGSNHWIVVNTDGVEINFYRSSSETLRQSTQVTIAPCFKSQPSLEPADFIERWYFSLREKGASLLKESKEEIFGSEMWLKDPDGNPFLLWVPKKIN